MPFYGENYNLIEYNSDKVKVIFKYTCYVRLSNYDIKFDQIKKLYQ